VALCVFIYVVPGVVVVASYIATGCTLLSGGQHAELLRRDGDSAGGYGRAQGGYGKNHLESGGTQSGYGRALAGRRRAAVMLLIVAGLFATFWLPYHVVNLYLGFAPSGTSSADAGTSWVKFVASLSLLLGHSHSAQNPIIYFVMSKAFKRDLIALLCRPTWHRPTQQVCSLDRS